MMNKAYKYEVKHIDRNEIRPNPLNKPFVADVDEKQIEALKDSIARMGLVHELLVIEKENEYRLISGEKRLMAISTLDEVTYNGKFPQGICCRVISPGEALTEEEERKLFFLCNTEKVC